jgi:hypothetical protein
MSPQFVDFDADGRLDIVAGIFDGSPHLVRGTEKGWGTPEQILDKNGARIVLNAFWNFDTKKWDSTNAHDADTAAADAAAAGAANAAATDGAARARSAEGHCTSAVAIDLDGDADLDLLLGDHRSGRVYARINEGDASKHAFAPKNQLVLADGKPIDVPGTVATMRLVDWNGDGRVDLACSGMGDGYGGKTGSGVWVYPNVGTGKAAVFGAPITLLAPQASGADTEPTRPVGGLYVDFGDHDGDGDLDMLAGGYSFWSPPAPKLTDAQVARRTELEAKLDDLGAQLREMREAVAKAVEGLDAEAAKAKRAELGKQNSGKQQELSKQIAEVNKELEPLRSMPKRAPFVWLYENLGKLAAANGGQR